MLPLQPTINQPGLSLWAYGATNAESCVGATTRLNNDDSTTTTATAYCSYCSCRPTPAPAVGLRLLPLLSIVGSRVDGLAESVVHPNSTRILSLRPAGLEYLTA